MVGHIFSLLISSVLSYSSQDRDDARTALLDIVENIVQNGYLLIGTNNRSTTWGKWSPEYVNKDRDFSDERGLQSLQILSFLSASLSVSSSSPDMFRKAFEELTNETNQYDRNCVNLKIQTPDDLNFSDDELSFLPLFILIFTIHHPTSLLSPDIVKSTLQRTFEIVRMERSSLWTTIFLVAAKQLNFVVEDYSVLKKDIEWNLQTWPLEHINYPTHNIDREDIFYGPGTNRFYLKHTDTLHSQSPIPANQRNQFRWNANPFDISSTGDGMVQVDPGAYLLSYWMARYYNILSNDD